MKRIVLSFALALLLLFGAIAPCTAQEVFSQESEAIYFSEGYGDAIVPPRPALLQASAGSFTYREQLNANARAIYDAFLTVTPSTTSFEVVLPEKLHYEQRNDSSVARGLLSVAAQAAIDAFFSDHPDVFWVDIATSYYNFYSNGTVSGGYDIWKILFNVSVLPAYQSNLSERLAALEAKIAAVPVTGANRYEKVTSINDWLAENVRYGTTAVTAHEAVGALLDGWAVCEGYAEACKLLCDYHDIPCILVRGEGGTNGILGPHMWNAIQMEDGKWYLCDMTWNDQIESGSGSIYTDFLLVGTVTMNTYFGGESFAATHVPTGDFSGSAKMIFTYPAFSETAYELPAFIFGDVDFDGDVDLNDLTQLAKYLAAWDVTIYEPASKVTGGADIGLNDLTLLAKYLASWTVVLGVAS